MKEGDVALAALPQSDGAFKIRPVVLPRQMPRHRDWLVCGISTQFSQQVEGFDEVITTGDLDFANSSLACDSLIRLSFLVVVMRRDISGTIGSISEDRLQRLRENLADYLLKGERTV